MGNANKQTGDERRQRKERRKPRLLPYVGKERRGYSIVREAEVFEISMPALKGARERRNPENSD